MQTARQNRHDLHHHNALLLEYISAGELERAKKHLQLQNEAWIEAALTTYCQHPTANAVLRHFERRTRVEGICYDVQASLPTVLSFSDTELGMLLSNLLENACEAAAFSGGAISFLALQEGDVLKIEQSNSTRCKCHFNKQGMPLSQKSSGGTGTHSIATVVTKHGGMLRFFDEGNEFVSQITLPLHKN